MSPVNRIQAMINIDFIGKISNFNIDDEEECTFISSLVGQVGASLF